MDFQKGDKVRFKDDQLPRSDPWIRGKVGKIERLLPDLPVSGALSVDIEFPDGHVQRGINVSRIEKA